MLAMAMQAMRTRFEIILPGDDDVFLRAVAEEVFAEIAACEQTISPFIQSSLISCINRQAHNRAVSTDPETFGLLCLCRDVWKKSKGSFDITVAPLLRTYGFRDTSAVSEEDELFTGNNVSMDYIHLDNEALSVSFIKEGIRIDLGAVGKGYALDLAKRVLTENGISNALLHGGTSSIVTLGHPPDSEAWVIKIGNKINAPRVSLRDTAISVSSVKSRTVEQPDGSTAGHIFNPKTGKPAKTSKYAVTICESAAAADAWSTAILVSDGIEDAVEHGVCAYLVSEDDQKVADYHQHGIAHQDLSTFQRQL